MSFFSYTAFPVAVSLLIHGLVIGVLMVGWESSPSPQINRTPKFIEAKLVSMEQKSTKKASAKKKPKKVDLTAKRKEQARLKREAEKKRKAKIRQQEAQKKKALAKQKEAERKRKEEQERVSKLEQERLANEQEQRLLEQQFEQALLEEEGLLLEEQMATEAQSYSFKFKQRVESQWSRPPSARTGMTCLLDIQLVPTGRIVSVTVLKSSGNQAFDRSAVQAVKKVEVFPEVKEMSPDIFEQYYRRFRFLFNPQDLRL